MIGATTSTMLERTRSISSVSALPSIIRPNAAKIRNKKAERWVSALNGAAIRKTEPARYFTSRGLLPSRLWVANQLYVLVRR